MTSTTVSLRAVAVTGAAGLIGSAIVRQLAARGVRVIALDTADLGYDLAGVTGAKLDLREDGVNAVLDRVAPDAVVHCAVHPGAKSNEEPTLDVHVNALGSIRVFDWCTRNQRHVVFPSSSALYGDQPRGPISESAWLHPGTIYNACKLACEHYLRILGETRGLPWTVLRLFPTYGAGHKPSHFQGIVNVLLTQLMAGDRVVVRGSLQRERDLVYVEDTASAFVAALFTAEARGEVMNVGTGRSATVADLVDALCRALGRDRAGVEVAEEPGIPGDMMYNVADISRARNVLAFEPRFSLDAGLTEFVRQRRAMMATAGR